MKAMCEPKETTEQKYSLSVPDTLNRKDLQDYVAKYRRIKDKHEKDNIAYIVNDVILTFFCMGFAAEIGQQRYDDYMDRYSKILEDPKGGDEKFCVWVYEAFQQTFAVTQGEMHSMV